LVVFWVVDFSVVVTLPEFGVSLSVLVVVVVSVDFSDTCGLAGAGAPSTPGAPGAPGAPAGPGGPWHPPPKVPIRIARTAIAVHLAIVFIIVFTGISIF
jgi:hypothetical protein